jgi:hypothetical protein
MCPELKRASDLISLVPMGVGDVRHALSSIHSHDDATSLLAPTKKLIGTAIADAKI